MKDPIVEEVRKHRQEYASQFGGDLDAMVADLRKIQATCGHQVVRRPAKKPRLNRQST
jgi:hypothetical protein